MAQRKASTDVESEIRILVSQSLGCDESEVKDNVSFADLGADSLDHVEIVIDLEEHFEIAISDDDGLGVVSLPTAVTIVNKHLAKG